MQVKRVKSKIVYRVPVWEYCNHRIMFTLDGYSQQKCRFCHKVGKAWMCVLSNDVLKTEADGLCLKTESCIRASAGFKAEIIDEPLQPIINSKEVVKQAVKEYQLLYNKLRKNGYTEKMAATIASKTLTQQPRK